MDINGLSIISNIIGVIIVCLWKHHKRETNKVSCRFLIIAEHSLISHALFLFKQGIEDINFGRNITLQN